MATAYGSSSNPSRRNLLQHAWASLSVGFLFQPSAAASQQPSMRFPSQPLARIAVTSYPFRAFIDSPTNRGRNPSLPGMDLKEFPAFVAEKFNVHSINPLIDHFSSSDTVYLRALRAAVDRAGSHIVDLGLPGRRFYAGDASVREAAVSFGQQCVDVAVEIGSPSVRQHIQANARDQRDVSLAASSLGKLAEYGAKRNIVINLENDNAVAEDPFFLVAIVEKVSNPYLRTLPDFGNSLIGHDQEYNHGAVKAMLGHVFNMCHVKHKVQGHDGKRYQVDLGPMFDLAKKSSFQGFFSMEFDTAGGDPTDGTKHLVEETLHYLT